MTDRPVDRSADSDALFARLKAPLVPTVLTQDTGFVKAGAVFWVLPAYAAKAVTHG